jgi:hypothetical protein
MTSKFTAITKAPKFSNTDAGQLRRCIYEATGSTKINDGYFQIYNDVAHGSTTHDRRLKVYGYNPFILQTGWRSDGSSLSAMTRAKQAKKFRNLIDCTFGARVYKLDISGEDIKLYLNDGHGGPFKPAPSNKPKKPAWPRPSKLSFQQADKFWKEATGMQDTKAIYGKVVTLVQDIPVFKKVHRTGSVGVIANLIIPAGARVYVTTSKCRANKAECVSMFTQTGRKEVQDAYSTHSYSFRYAKGQKLVPDRFGRASEGQCSGGIHFFIDVNDALNYY